jgi:general secretion pathway protein K
VAGFPNPESRIPNPRSQSGVALLLVLWACALLAILLGGYALVARTEGLQARYQFAQAQARYAAEAGLARAAYALRQSDPGQRWRSDGQPYTFHFDNATVRVRITAEDGKVDLNTATPQVLDGLFRSLGVDDERARALSSAIQDWRDADDASLPAGAEAAQYRSAGRDYGPRDGPFASVEEVQLVLGMDAALYAKAAPLLTVWSGRSMPNPAHAPAAVLAALPGMDRAAAGAFASARSRADPGQGLPALPNGMQVLAGGGGVTHSVRSEATLADGTHAVLRATIRWQAGRGGWQPYAVLRWEEGQLE